MPPKPTYKRCTLAISLAFLAFAVIKAEGQELQAAKRWERPILTIQSTGAKGNKYGFEGGRVLKIKGTYHMFTSEMVGEPHWVKMRLGYWTSTDRLHWNRVGTVAESSGDFTGKDQRAALWSPLPVYDPDEGRWNLFYVAYQAAPDTPQQWLTNYEGRIWRAVSETKGEEGIGGPYQDVGIILQRGKDSDAWEGLQGTDSFFPFRVGDGWYAFYGSAHTEKLPISLWQVGLATARNLAGPWTRCTALNPLKVENRFIENPIVTELNDGTFVAVYDTDAPNAIGYTFSTDGVHWSAGQHLIVQEGSGVWATEVRTPLGLIPEGNDSFTLFYTANEKLSGAGPDANGINTTPGSLGLVDVRLIRNDKGKGPSTKPGAEKIGN
ncbi:MAG TPA: hypothetical protein VKV39_07750 [Candidatus Sulfotelmatobacter sp.]|nr:hypothetical protein [Candidatus Sulfotelmatobacter sp.]